jgi:hypothetical protein
MNVPSFFRRRKSVAPAASSARPRKNRRRGDGEAGGCVELFFDHYARLELAARRHGQVQREDAACARGADVEGLAVQDQVHGRLKLPPCDVGQQLPGPHIEDLHCVAGFVRHVQMLPVHDDAAHRVPWLAVLVEHYPEAERRWHIERRVVTVLGKAPPAGRDERTGEKLPGRIVRSPVTPITLFRPENLRAKTALAAARDSGDPRT